MAKMNVQHTNGDNAYGTYGHKFASIEDARSYLESNGGGTIEIAPDNWDEWNMAQELDAEVGEYQLIVVEISAVNDARIEIALELIKARASHMSAEDLADYEHEADVTAITDEEWSRAESIYNQNLDPIDISSAEYDDPEIAVDNKRVRISLANKRINMYRGLPASRLPSSSDKE